MIYHPNINGRAVSYPIKGHSKNPEIGKNYIRDIKRRFDIPDSVL